MNQTILNKKRIPIYMAYFAVIYVLNILFFIDLKFFLLLTYNIRTIMGLLVMVISINTYRISHNTLFTFLAISLGLSGILDFLSVVTAYHYSLSNILNELLYIRMFSDFLSLFSLILCSKIHDKNFNLRSVFVIYSTVISSLVLLFCILFFAFRIFPSLNTKILLNFRIKDILNLILFILSLYPVYMFFQINNSIRDNDLKHIFILSILPALSMICFFLESIKDFLGFFSFVGNTILLFHLFFVCKTILNAVLKKPYEMLFYNLDKKAKEVEKIKDYYKTVIEALPLSIIVFNNNKIKFVNIATLELLNYKSKEDIYDIDIYEILDEKSISHFEKNVNNRFPIFKTLLKKSHGDIVDAKLTPIDIVFHGSDSTMLVIKDISAKKKVRELRQTLEQKIEEENIKTEFLSNVSHELRTPINVIYSILQLEDIYMKNGDLESISKHNKTLKQNCLRLLRISNNLIDSTKIEGNFFIPSMNHVNIVTLIENIVSSVSEYIEIKNMMITFDTDNEDIYSLCDQDLIERIILNLISNSIKYASSGGNIWVNIYDEGDFVKIIFKDNGPGIPKEKCLNIFERFVQVDKSLNISCEGSGIGLSLVKSLIDLHKGNINLKSDTGMGCEFTIMLPAAVCGFDEVATANDCLAEDYSIIDKINIEFSDIYF